jgi:predicted Zn-dependent protease
VRGLALLALAIAAFPSFAADAPLLEVLASELDRNYKVLKEKGDPPAYFISYSVTEDETHSLSATLGSLQINAANHRRLLDVSVRVGSRELDNYHRMKGERPQFTRSSLIALDGNPDSIRQRLWLDTDRTYRRAAERLTKLKTSTQLRTEDDKSNDFSEEESSRAVMEVPAIRFAEADWLGIVRRVSAAFARYPGVLNSQISVATQRNTKYFVNSEGTRLRHGRGYCRVVISAHARAAIDGMDLSLMESFESTDPSGLPKEDTLMAAVKRLASEIEGLTKAPLMEPFAGPAILSGRAAGVFFHEIFGHRIEGHRQKDEAEGQTFTKSVGQPILPEFLSVVFDPTRKSAEGVDLNGSYAFDEEGVKARPVTVVDKGVLKTFLMSRSPIEGFPHSNGHGRKAPGAEVVSRQSNLFVESSKQVRDGELRQMLIEEARKQNKPYGLYFKEVTGGYTTTGRSGLQAYAVIPLVVYRVYTDGRPDELVRGVDIVGTPLASFSRILATSDKREVFNGMCGAESGSVPVSAIAPALLVSELEIQKKDRSRERPPILPRPQVREGK